MTLDELTKKIRKTSMGIPCLLFCETKAGILKWIRKNVRIDKIKTGEICAEFYNNGEFGMPDLAKAIVKINPIIIKEE